MYSKAFAARDELRERMYPFEGEETTVSKMAISMCYFEDFAAADAYSPEQMDFEDRAGQVPR